MIMENGGGAQKVRDSAVKNRWAFDDPHGSVRGDSAETPASKKWLEGKCAGHANSASQALARFAHCVVAANVGLPHRSTREAIALAIDLVVHIDRKAGCRTVTEALGVAGYDGATDQFELDRFWVSDGGPPKESEDS